MKKEEDVDLDDIYNDRKILCFLTDYADSETELHEIHWRIREYERSRRV